MFHRDQRSMMGIPLLSPHHYAMPRGSRLQWLLAGLLMGISSTLTLTTFTWMNFNPLLGFQQNFLSLINPPFVRAVLSFEDKSILFTYEDPVSKVVPEEMLRDASTECVQARPNATFPCDFYRWMASPSIIQGGSVYASDAYLVVGGTACGQSTCKYPSGTASQDSNIAMLPGNAIAVAGEAHIGHVFMDMIQRLVPLKLSGTLDNYPNATVLYHSPGQLTDNSFRWLELTGALKVLGLQPSNFVYMKKKGHSMLDSLLQRKATVYKVPPSRALLIPKDNFFHYKSDVTHPYNLWLTHHLKEIAGLRVVPKPTRQLYVTRKGYRRSIVRDKELYQHLKSTLLPNLEYIDPNDISEEEQAKIFTEAKFILSPHGTNLQYLYFCNWQEVVVLEIMTREKAGSFRKDYPLKQHHHLLAYSVPCDKAKKCNPTELDIDVDETEVARIINDNLLVDGNPNEFRSQGCLDFEVARYGQKEEASK